MADEMNNTVNIEETNTDTSAMYIEQINALKQNTVSRAQYDKVMQENKQLLESLVNGSGQASTEEPPKPSADELRKDLFSGKEMTNLDYCTKALALRDAVLEETGKDIFVGEGRNLTPTNEAYASAAKVAEVMAECIEAASGSPELFTAELMRRTNDVKLPGAKR